MLVPVCYPPPGPAPPPCPPPLWLTVYHQVRAPTRPHPEASDLPPFNETSYAAAKQVDTALDQARMPTLVPTAVFLNPAAVAAAVDTVQSLTTRQLAASAGAAGMSLELTPDIAAAVGPAEESGQGEEGELWEGWGGQGYSD
jgi:hypothetical protein